MGKKGGRRPRAAKPRGVLNAATVGTALCVLALAIAVGLMARQLGGRSIAVRVTAGGGSSRSKRRAPAPAVVPEYDGPLPPDDGLDGIMATARGARRVRAVLGFVQHMLHSDGSTVEDGSIAEKLAPHGEKEMAAVLLSLRVEERLFTQIAVRAALLWNGAFVDAKTQSIEHATSLWKGRAKNPTRAGAERLIAKLEQKCNAVLGALFDAIASPDLAARLGTVDDAVPSVALKLRGGDNILGALPALRDGDSDDAACSIARIMHHLWVDRIGAIADRLTAVVVGSARRSGDGGAERALFEVGILAVDALESLTQIRSMEGAAAEKDAMLLGVFSLRRGWLELTQLAASPRCLGAADDKIQRMVGYQVFTDLHGTKVGTAKAAFAGLTLFSAVTHQSIGGSLLRDWSLRSAFSLPPSGGVSPARIHKLWLAPRLARLRWAIRSDSQGGLGLDLSRRLVAGLASSLDVTAIGLGATLAHALAQHAHDDARAALGEMIAMWPDVVNATDSRGATALHQAALHSNAPAVRLLLAKGASAALADVAGRTPGMLARAAHAAPSIVALLPLPHGDAAAEGVANDECEITTVDAANMTAVDFELRFRTAQMPVLVRGAFPAEYWPAATHWASRSRLGARYGALEVATGSIPYAKEFGVAQRATRTLAEYTSGEWFPSESVNGGGGDGGNLSYLFSLFDPVSAPTLWADIVAGLPLWLKIWVEEEAGDQRRAQIYLGPAGTGAPMHYHSQAMNALVRGSKKWFLRHPSFAHYDRTPVKEWVRRSKDDAEHAVRGAPEDRPSLIQCVQRAGDILFVPSGWGHAVLNLEEVAGFAVEESAVSASRGFATGANTLE